MNDKNKIFNKTKPRILAIITARGGSRGIPGKNIKNLCGKPLIVYTIEAAQQSGVFDRIIVSTDDEKIAEAAKRYGAEVPFLRPAELAQDSTQSLPVIQHAVQWLRDNENYQPDYVMLLQPTSPLRQSFHIKEAVDLISKTKADSVLGVSEISSSYSPHKAMLVDERGYLKLFNGNPIYKRIARRQDLPKSYFSNGALYLFKTGLLFDEIEPNFYGGKTAPYIIDIKYAVDIDTPEDWKKAEEILSQ